MLDVPLFWLWRYDDLVTAVEVPPRATHPVRLPHQTAVTAVVARCAGTKLWRNLKSVTPRL